MGLVSGDSQFAHWLRGGFLWLVLFAALGSFSRWGIESLVWAFVYVATLGWVMLDLERLLKAPLLVLLVLVFPVFALVSTFWSEAAGHTFRISFHLTMTAVIALWIGLNFSAIQVFKALLAATMLGLLLSYGAVLWGGGVAFSDVDQFFIGIYTQKNVLGRLVLLLAISLLVVGGIYRKVWLLWPLVLLLFLPLLDIQSATSTIFFGVTLLLPILVIAVRARSEIRILLVVATFAILAVLIGLYTSVELRVIAPFLEHFGKDSTLTGRTYLWQVALKVFTETPVLGMGFDAFWNAQGVDEAQQIWERYGKLMGFHNTFLETLVGLGVIGAGLLLFTLGAFLWAGWRWVSLSHSHESIGAMYLLVITVLMCFVEIISFREFDVFYLLPCVFFVIAVREIREGKSLPQAVIIPAN